MAHISDEHTLEPCEECGNSFPGIRSFASHTCPKTPFPTKEAREEHEADGHDCPGCLRPNNPDHNCCLLCGKHFPTTMEFLRHRHRRREEQGRSKTPDPPQPPKTEDTPEIKAMVIKAFDTCYTGQECDWEPWLSSARLFATSVTGQAFLATTGAFHAWITPLFSGSTHAIIKHALPPPENFDDIIQLIGHLVEDPDHDEKERNRFWKMRQRGTEGFTQYHARFGKAVHRRSRQGIPR